MAAALAAKIMRPSALGAKALSPSGVAVVGQEFEPSPEALGQPANTLLSVLPVKRRAIQEFSCLSQSFPTNVAAVVAKGAVKPPACIPLSALRIHSPSTSSDWAARQPHARGWLG
jgi:hypothetical protein